MFHYMGPLLLLVQSTLSWQLIASQQCSTWLDKIGGILVNHVIKTTNQTTHTQCWRQCYEHPNCHSINVHLDEALCDLNNATHLSNPEDIVDKKKAIYLLYDSHPHKNCSDQLCPRGKKCLMNDDGKSYQCITGPKSCLEILVSGTAVGDGEYSIYPGDTGKPLKVYCDMTTDSGGWTLTKRVVLPTPKALPDKWNKNYRYIMSKYNDVMEENTIVSGVVMKNILDYIGFTQMWFYCRKQSVNRTLSIITAKNASGAAVVRFFTDTASFKIYEFPDACGSFVRLPEDDSVLAQNCEKWGKVSDDFIKNKWGAVGFNGPYRLTSRPMTYGDQHSMGIRKDYGHCCDDGFGSEAKPLSVGDKWEFYVR